MITKIIAYSFLGILTSVVLNLISRSGLGRIVYNHTPGTCRLVPNIDGGSEDIKLTRHGLAFISSGMPKHIDASDESTVGRVLIFDMKNPGAGAKNLDIDWIDFNPNRFNPHGISIWEEPNGDVFLYVINHAADRDRVECFRYLPGKDRLKHEKTITDDLFYLTNNLLVVGKDQFFITNMLQSRTSIMMRLELFSMLNTGSIVYYDGKKGKFVAEGVQTANGIAMSPDKKYLYVVAYSNLNTYKIKADNFLDLVQETDMGAAEDNISVDSAGDLVIGGHPIMWKVVLHMNNAIENAPSHVLKLKVKDGLPTGEMTELFADNGSLLSASSVAVPYGNALLIGTIHGKLLYCDAGTNSPPCQPCSAKNQPPSDSTKSQSQTDSVQKNTQSGSGKMNSQSGTTK